jgi:hypothetical protein
LIDECIDIGTKFPGVDIRKMPSAPDQFVWTDTCLHSGVPASSPPFVIDAWIDTVPSGLRVEDPQGTRQAVSHWKEYAAEKVQPSCLMKNRDRDR